MNANLAPVSSSVFIPDSVVFKLFGFSCTVLGPCAASCILILNFFILILIKIQFKKYYERKFFHGVISSEPFRRPGRLLDSLR
jgi:hypothetical protein